MEELSDTGPETERKLPGRIHHMNGREYLYFSGTSYLGLSTHDSYISLLKEGLDIYGTTFGSSRRSNLSLDIYGKLEQTLANWMGMESCLSCSSGTLAGRLVLEFIQRFRDVYYMPGSHPASWDSHSDLNQLDRNDWIRSFFEKLSWKTDREPVCILVSSVDPLGPAVLDLSWLHEMDYSGQVYLFVDDSHGIGVLGDEGRGIISGLKLPINVTLVTYGSLAKGMGTQGGWIASDYPILFEIMNLPLFGGSSPMSPAFAYALDNGIDLVREQQKDLLQKVTHFNERFFTSDHFSCDPRLPIYTSAKKDLSQYLYDRGMIISDFNYPGPEDPRYIRLILNASHKHEDINTLSFYLQQFYEPDKI